MTDIYIFLRNQEDEESKAQEERDTREMQLV